MKTVFWIIVLSLLFGFTNYSYSSTEEEAYTQQCRNFLDWSSGEFKGESFEQLLGYMGSAMICGKEVIYNKLTDEEKDKLESVRTEIEKIRKRITKEEMERVDESLAAIMPEIDKALWRELSGEELKELDTLLRGKWDCMRRALEQDDIDKAVSYFHHETREMYWKNFAEMKPEGRKRISADLVNITMGKVEMGTAIYEVRSSLKSGEKVPFQIIFVKDLNGEWVIKLF